MIFCTSDPKGKYESLEKYGKDLTAMSRAGKLDPVIGRDDEIRGCIQILSRRTKNNHVLIGEPGVGKTAISEEMMKYADASRYYDNILYILYYKCFAQRILQGDVPQALMNRKACKGMRNIYTGSKILLVPIKEMTGVLSLESKAIDLSRDTWVRMKIGTYKGDLAKVVDVDNVKQRVTVKLIPRIDLQALANKLEGREVPKKTTFTPPSRFMNVDEAREMHIHVERRRDPMTGDYFENINGMMFKDGFLYKIVSMKSISTQNIQPNFDELEKFRQPNENGDGDIASLSTLFANRKKGHFIKGDRVIVIKGDLKNLKGSFEKVEEGTVHIKPHATGLPETLVISERELCKYFEIGNHVKVVSGVQEGVTGMVLTAQEHLVNMVSDTTKEVGSLDAQRKIHDSRFP